MSVSTTEKDILPVLNDVVESGNESIIQSTRIGREVLRELEVLQQEAPVKFVLKDHILDDEEEEISQIDLIASDSTDISDASAEADDELELMIDELVDRHITELRKDIRRLLLRARHSTGS